MELTFADELDLDVFEVLDVDHFEGVSVGFDDDDFGGEVENFAFVGVVVLGEFDFAVQKVEHFEGLVGFDVLLFFAYRHFNYK